MSKEITAGRVASRGDILFFNSLSRVAPLEIGLDDFLRDSG
jgi:hypothetical protein